MGELTLKQEVLYQLQSGEVQSSVMRGLLFSSLSLEKGMDVRIPVGNFREDEPIKIIYDALLSSTYKGEPTIFLKMPAEKTKSCLQFFYLH